MSTDHYDLAARLRAASTGRVVARSAYAPALPPRAPVALTAVTGPRGAVTLTATELVPTNNEVCQNERRGLAVRSATGHGIDALSAVAALGIGSTIQLPASSSTHPVGPSGRTAPLPPPLSVTPGPATTPAEPEAFRTLVVADAATLRILQMVLQQTRRGSRWDPQASVLAWWLQRAEHPGSPAFLNVVATCSARWFPGEPPAADRQLSTWQGWLGVAATTSLSLAGRDAAPHPGTATGESLLELAALVTAGVPLPGLGTCAETDERSWEYHLLRLSGGWDFRRNDTRAEAALGLATRCDAAELFDSLRLDDPLVADRARFDGSVVTGRLNWLHDGEAEVVADRLVSRLRVDAPVEGTATLTAGSGPATLAPFRAMVADTRMTSNGELVVTLADVRVRTEEGHGNKARNSRGEVPALAVGAQVQMRAERVSAAQQSRSRRNRRGRYVQGKNWMMTPDTPTPTRRDVPWDVVIAAAND